MEEITIERVSQPDLAFTGELIGQSNGLKPAVRIYRTKTGKFITALSVDPERAKTGHFDKPAEAVTWLSTQMGSITEDAQRAIEQAAKKDETFKAFWTERVE